MGTMTYWACRGVVRLGAVAMCAGLLAIPAIGAPFTATGKILQYFPDQGSPAPGEPKSTPTGESWTQAFGNNAGLGAGNAAYASAKKLGTYAEVEMSTMTWWSGSITSTSSASTRELLFPDWQAAAAHAGNLPAASLVMGFQVTVSGSVSATSDGGNNSGASVRYDATIGDATASGTRGTDASGAFTLTGDWGALYLESTIPWNSNVYLDLSASSYASAGKTYLSFPKARASADFSHTLLWGGVQRIWVVDALGNRTELVDAYIPLIGQESGADYFYGAPVASSVPEPATLMLLAPGLLMVWWWRRGTR